MYDYLEKNNEYYKKLRKKRRLKNRIFSLAIVIIIIISLWIKSSIIKQESIPYDAVESFYWIVFIIERINFILILLLFMLISREIIMLVLEWYQKKTGSHYKAKIVIIFLMLAIVPTAFTIFISSRLLKFSIDQWFDIDLAKNIKYSQSIADSYIDLQKSILSEITSDIARNIGSNISSWDNTLPGGIMEGSGEFIRGLMVVNKGKAMYSNIKDEYINNYIRDNIFYNAGDDDDLIKGRILSDSETYILMMRKLSDNSDFLLVTYNTLPAPLSGYIDEVYGLSSKFEQQSLLQTSMKNYYYYSLLLISTLIIFMAVWFGLHFSKEITVPMVSLIQGTQRVARGDFNFALAKHSGQEIGTLIDSFNIMIRDIRQSRDSLQKANKSLEEKTMELEANTRFIELLIQNISSGILVLSMDYKIIIVNKAFMKYFGYSETELIGRDISSLFTGDYKPFMEIINHSRNAGEKEISQIFAMDINNVYRTIKISAQVIFTGSAEDQHIFMVIEDISDIIRAEKLTAWKEVAKRIAHEIKNPLTPLQLSVQRICRTISKNEDLSPYSAFFEENRFILEESVNTIKLLVDEFNRFAKLPSINPRKDDINILLNEIYTYYISQDLETRFRLVLQDTLPSIMLDREIMKRALNNIIINAIDAVDSDGEITIASIFDQRQGCVAVEIRDNGRGLTKEEKENLFLPYFSTKKDKSGTGLGLSIVLSIVSDHMAYIKVLDNEPKGCTFRIEFPCTGE